MQCNVTVLLFAASRRTESLNARLVQVVRLLLERRGAQIDLATMEDFDCPSYDGDDERAVELLRW